MKIGRLIFETYIGCTGKKVFRISVANKYGGSFGYADTSLLKVFWNWCRPFLYVNGATMWEFMIGKLIIQFLKPKYWNKRNRKIRISFEKVGEIK